MKKTRFSAHVVIV